MASVSSTTSAQPASQLVLQQLKLQQAQRNADQAEQNARALRAQADAAQQEALRAQENARNLSAKSDLAESVVGQARRGLAATRSAAQMQTQFERLAANVTGTGQTAETPPSTSTTTVSTTSPAPVVNTQGQVTGTVVNETA